MNSYSFADRAIQDLDEICDHVAQSDSGAASRLFDAIRQKCKLVAGFPAMGKSYSQLSPRLRGFTVDGYVIILLSKRGWY